MENNDQAAEVHESGLDILHEITKADVLTNLSIMSYNWCVSYFVLHLLFFYNKHMPGNIYQNTIMMNLGLMIGAIFAVYMLRCTSVQNALVLNYSVTLVGSVLIYLIGFDHPIWVPVFVLLTSAGIVGVYSCSQFSTIKLYPASVTATCLGIS